MFSPQKGNGNHNMPDDRHVTNPTVVLILQYISVPNHHTVPFVHVKLIQGYMSIISQ